MPFTISDDTDALDAALQLGRYGLRVVWVHSTAGKACSCGRTCATPGKHPVLPAWQKRASTDENELRDQFSRIRHAVNIGVCLGEQPTLGYLVAVDVDDEERMIALSEEHGALPTTLAGKSSRGFRLFFRLPADAPIDRVQNVTAVGGPSGVDFKARNGQVVVGPSMHESGERYSWCYPLADIAELPAGWLHAVLKAPERPKWVREYTPTTMKADKHAQKRASKYFETSLLGEAAMLARTNEGSRNTALHLSLCRILPLAHGLFLPLAHAYAVRELSGAARATGLDDREIAGVVASAEKWVRESGAVRMLPYEASAVQAPAAPKEDLGLIQDRGSPAAIAENVARLLRSHAAWGGGPRLDTFGHQIRWPDPLPEPVRHVHRTQKGVLADADALAVQGWLIAQDADGRVRAGKDVVNDGILLAASRNSYDSLTAYVESLPAWDGVRRLDTWLVKYFGADDDAVTRRTGRAWLVSAIARAFDPGCVADGMLVLEGLEGLGKNYGMATLFGGHPYLQTTGNYRIGKHTEADRIAGSCWVLHDEELGSKQTPIESVKAWLTRVVDPYRLPYGRELLFIKRRCVPVGSTNRTDWLDVDEEGRRFWPVRVTAVDVTAIARDREQLLSEAREAYRARERWTIGRADVVWDAMAEARDNRRGENPLEEQIAKVLWDEKPVDGFSIRWLVEKLNIPPERANNVGNKIGASLKRLGFKVCIEWDGMKTVRIWR